MEIAGNLPGIRLQAVPFSIVEVARNSRARKNWSERAEGGLGERREKFLLAPVSLRSTDQKGTACSLAWYFHGKSNILHSNEIESILAITSASLAASI